MSIEEEDLMIIMDTHRIFLEDEWEFTKIQFAVSYWPYETPQVWLNCANGRPLK